MARRSSFSSILRSAARSAAKAQRQYEAEQRRLAKEQERERKALERERISRNKEATKIAKQEYVASRIQEVEDLNQELRDRIRELQSILEHTLEINDTIAFESLRVGGSFEAFTPPEHLTQERPPPDKARYLSRVRELGLLERLVPGAKARHQAALEAEMKHYRAVLARYEEREKQRLEALMQERTEYEQKRQAFLAKQEQRSQEVDELESAYFAVDPDAVVAYCSMVLERSLYPDGFPQEFQIAYVQASSELVIEYELPDVSIVPEVEEYRYVKSRDDISSKARKKGDIKVLYADLVAAVALRTVHEVLEADQAGAIKVVVFSGFVQTVDPATGQDIRPHLVSVRTTQERFEELDLSRVDKALCLRNLGAQVSPRPEEMQAVKPIVDFDMVDRRFVEQSDVLSDLEARPNLMDLNPFEFENLVANLFGQMGLDTKQTRSSKDGGVDAIAYDTRPVVGGKIVIQAKRYKNTVGVSAVRDLYGTMMNEGANKGILVTTSSYGPDAYDFAKDKPVELIDGGGLLYLLDNIGVQARIILPA